MDIQFTSFSQIDLNDTFFDSLRADYVGFNEWFVKKQQEDAKAFIMASDAGLEAFLYLKSEDGQIDDVEPPLPAERRLKIGTFKINPHGTRLGERFIKKIFDYCIKYKFKEAYVTIFPKHGYLLGLFKKYGFNEIGRKVNQNGEELVLQKKFNSLEGELHRDYPLINPNAGKKYLLAIYPGFHTRLFPDSILNNENFDIIQDVSYTNSIHKIYICKMKVSSLRKSDIIVIYRTGDGQGPAYYRAVITSVCVVEETRRKKDFASFDEFYAYCQAYSVFTSQELKEQYDSGDVFVIKMTYNAAFSRRVNRKILIEEIGLDPNAYWGFLSLREEQFQEIIKAGAVDESLIINQA
ncbi:N-acetyltransferase [Larkinella bovis]|uniref:N-acetyltransferase n=1 Tax=Larkinella bovis TaxID=683041 RepID=A0ABW0ILM4_9BACT